MYGVSVVISSATRHSLFRYLYGPHQTFKQLIHNESTTLRNSCAHNFGLRVLQYVQKLLIYITRAAAHLVTVS